jgi:predicted nucleic acid-binding protein
LTELLLDATVWVASTDVGDVDHEPASTLVQRAADKNIDLAALDLTLYEVANVAVLKWKSPTQAAELVRLVVTACGERVQRVDQELLREAGAVAADRRITVYDAAYVAASRRRGSQLVSADIADLVRPGFAITPAEAAGA